MRKICSGIVLVIFIFMITITGVSAKDSGVTISKVSCSNMNNGVVKDKLQSEFKGLEITVEDSKFSKVGDYTKCELEITNQSKDEIAVDTTSISNLSNEFVSYELTSTDNNTSIAVGSTKKYHLNIDYKKEYDKDTVLDNVVELKLHSNNNSIINPQTASTLFVILGIVFIAIIVTLIVLFTNKKTKGKISFLLILGILAVIPTAYALTSVTITLKNKIIIETPGYHVYYGLYRAELPEHELKNYDLTNAVCDYEHYTLVEGDAAQTKYYYCVGPIVIDSGKYKEGSQANLHNYVYNSFGNCEEQEGYSVCGRLYKKYIADWVYVARDNPNYKENDKEVMNFTRGLIDDGWQEYGGFVVGAPNTFTMPAHDVFFGEFLPPQ